MNFTVTRNQKLDIVQTVKIKGAYLLNVLGAKAYAKLEKFDSYVVNKLYR